MATTETRTVTLADMVERARALLPNLRERARQTEQLRHLANDTVDELRSGGFFRVLQPSRFGGFELDYGRTQVELRALLGTGVRRRCRRRRARRAG